jgi:hypothetical protein
MDSASTIFYFCVPGEKNVLASIQGGFLNQAQELVKSQFLLFRVCVAKPGKVYLN